jgi:hypothetical protein
MESYSIIDYKITANYFFNTARYRNLIKYTLRYLKEDDIVGLMFTNKQIYNQSITMIDKETILHVKQIFIPELLSKGIDSVLLMNSEWWRTLNHCSFRLKLAIMKEFCSRWANNYWFNKDRIHQIHLNSPYEMNRNMLLSILERCTSITLLTLNNIKISMEEFKTLLGLVSGLKSLQLLQLDWNKFNEPIMKALQHSLLNHPSIKVLSLSRCSLNDTLIEMLSEALPQSLTELRLGDNLFTSKCLGVLTANLLKLGNFELLNIDGVKLEMTGARIISEYVQSEDCGLKTLSINQSGIGNNELKVILNGLKMSGLNSISIGDLNTNEEGFAVLVKILKELPTEYIYFKDNIITENVFYKLIKVIQDSKVKLIDLRTKKFIATAVSPVTTEFYKIIV